MKIGLIVTGVASPVTLNKICLIMRDLSSHLVIRECCVSVWKAALGVKQWLIYQMLTLNKLKSLKD